MLKTRDLVGVRVPVHSPSNASHFLYLNLCKSTLESMKIPWINGCRPWWMNLIFLFCLYMTFIYLPFDLFVKPVALDEEVWFGFVLRGWWAKATEPLHWLIYGAGAYGFWKMARWMWPWAAVYAAQVSLACWSGTWWMNAVPAGWRASWRRQCSCCRPSPCGGLGPRFASGRSQGLRHENQSAAPHGRSGRGEPRRTRRHIRTDRHDDRAASLRRRPRSLPPHSGRKSRSHTVRPTSCAWVHSGISSI